MMRIGHLPQNSITLEDLETDKAQTTFGDHPCSIRLFYPVLAPKTYQIQWDSSCMTQNCDQVKIQNFDLVDENPKMAVNAVRGS